MSPNRQNSTLKSHVTDIFISAISKKSQITDFFFWIVVILIALLVAIFASPLIRYTVAQAALSDHAFCYFRSNISDVQGSSTRPMNSQGWRQGALAKAKFLQWHRDRVSKTLAHISTALLDIATEQYLSVVFTFNLDLLHCPWESWPHVQNIL